MSALPPPPASHRDEISETLHGIQVDDPYRWLEDVSKPEVQSWVTAQNAYTRQLLDALPSQQPLRQRFAELMYLDAVSPPEERGGQQFYTRRYKTREKPVLMVRPARGSEPGDKAAEERTLLDPNELRADGSISLGNWFVSWDGKYVAYTLHENNADEATLFVRDVATGKDSAIDRITGAKYAGPTWTPDNQGFYYEWLPTDPSIPVSERPGRTELRYHRLGTDPAQDPLIFPSTGDPKTFLGGGVTRDGRWLIVSVQQGWQKNDVYVRDTRLPLEVSTKSGAAQAQSQPQSALPAGISPPGAGAARAKANAARFGFVPFVSGLDAMFRVSWWNGVFYVHTNYEAPNYRVLSLRPKTTTTPTAAKQTGTKQTAAKQAGKPNEQLAPSEFASSFAIDHWRELVPESKAKLDDANVIGGALVLSYLENASSRLAIHDLSGKHLRSVSLPGLGSASGLVGDPDRDEAYFAFTSFAVPTQVYQASIVQGSTSLWSKIDLPLDTSQMQVEQTWYTSKDGTKVSMFVVHKAGIKLDASHPTLLYGYGGFNIDMTPAFSALAAVWLEQGGVYAVPNLRGGGEYGEAWHRAGMGPNKQNVFDDFAAAAEHLIERGYTSADHLAIYGGSNGGLLVGASMVQRPELFRAVVCAVPLLDMVRYHLFGSGQTWIAEYGSPEDATQFATLLDYSPYHHVLPGVKYPALLMMAADSDDRVDPMHARKFTAAVQWAEQQNTAASSAAAGNGAAGNTAADRPALFRVEEHAGHGGADLVKKRVVYNADLIAFLLDQLAPRSAGSPAAAPAGTASPAPAGTPAATPARSKTGAQPP